MSKLKWTIKGHLEIVYTGTKKNMTLYTGWAELDDYGRGQCINGVKVGRWEYFHTNGTPMLVESYDEQGQMHGCSQSFYDHGRLRKDAHYEHGRSSSDTYVYYEDGSLRERTIHTPEGDIWETLSYYQNGGLRHHLQLERYAGKRGRMLRECWYHENGGLWVERTYRDGGELIEERRND